MAPVRYQEVPGAADSAPVRHGLSGGRRARRFIILLACAAGLCGATFYAVTAASLPLQHRRLRQAWTELARLDHSLDDELARLDASVAVGGDSGTLGRVCVVSVADRGAVLRGTPAYQDDHQEDFDAAVVVSSARFAWALRHGCVQCVAMLAETRSYRFSVVAAPAHLASHVLSLQRSCDRTVVVRQCQYSVAELAV